MKINSKKLEKQIKGIKKIAKITKAMKIISSINIKKIQSKITENIIVLNELRKNMTILFRIKELNKSIFSKNEEKSLIRILFSSDMGLCGGYNNELFKYINKNQKKKDLLIIIGKKGILFFEYHKKKIIWSELSENFENKKIDELTKFILDNSKLNIFNIVYMSTTKTKKNYIKEFQIYPFKTDEKIDLNKLEKFKIEPSINSIYDKSINFYLEILLTKIKDESKFTEEISRRFAMENANENANEMIIDLKLKYNRLRQEKITKEIINISQSD